MFKTYETNMVQMGAKMLEKARWDAGWLNVDPPPREDYDEDDYEDSGKKSRRVNPYAT